MKRCPTCQKEFADSMRFCQTDGTPLADSIETPAPLDPFKTMVAPPMSESTGRQSEPADAISADLVKKEDDLLQIPEAFDPMKTMVVSDDAKKSVPPSNPIREPVVSAPALPVFTEPDLVPPSFDAVSGGLVGSPTSVDPPKMDAPPMKEPAKFDIPLASPFGEPPKFEATPMPSEGSPFNAPPKPSTPSPFDSPSKPSTPSPFDSPPVVPSFNNPPTFGDSPFNQAQPSFGQPSNDPFSAPGAAQNDWSPPPAPVAAWGDQGLGANTPFTPPPVGAGGVNQTLPIVSLVFGCVSLCCYVSPITGIVALITGYLGLKNIKNDPQNYGGRGLAIAGMITGGVLFLIGAAYWVYIIVIVGLIASGSLR